MRTCLYIDYDPLSSGCLCNFNAHGVMGSLRSKRLLIFWTRGKWGEQKNGVSKKIIYQLFPNKIHIHKEEELSYNTITVAVCKSFPKKISRSFAAG